MTVKELKKQLKGKYTDVTVFHTKHRDAIPYTLLGKGYYQATNKKKWIDNQEVDEYELYHTGIVKQYDANLNFVRSYDGIELIIYIK